MHSRHPLKPPRRPALGRAAVSLALSLVLSASAALLAFHADAARAADGASAPARSLQPVIAKAVRGPACVEPAPVMRREHMRLLRHQRDDTVHGGVRGARHSLKGCVQCHASAATGSVAAGPQDFCVSCHAYAAVRIDCFECHATRPAGHAGARAGQEAGG